MKSLSVSGMFVVGFGAVVITLAVVCYFAINVARVANIARHEHKGLARLLWFVFALTCTGIGWLFFEIVILDLLMGGDPIRGKVDGEQFFLGRAGEYREVSCVTYWTIFVVMSLIRSTFAILLLVTAVLFVRARSHRRQPEDLVIGSSESVSGGEVAPSSVVWRWTPITAVAFLVLAKALEQLPIGTFQLLIVVVGGTTVVSGVSAFCARGRIGEIVSTSATGGGFALCGAILAWWSYALLFYPRVDSANGQFAGGIVIGLAAAACLTVGGSIMTAVLLATFRASTAEQDDD